MGDSLSRSTLRPTAPEFVPGDSYQTPQYPGYLAQQTDAPQYSVLPPTIPLYGSLHGITFDAQKNITSDGRTLASAARKSMKVARPKALYSEDRPESLHIQSPALRESIKAQRRTWRKNVEILCRCNGLAIWIPGEGMENHVCENTGVCHGGVWDMTNNCWADDLYQRNGAALVNEMRGSSPYPRDFAFPSPPRTRRNDEPRTPLSQTPRRHHRSQGSWQSQIYEAPHYHSETAKSWRSHPYDTPRRHPTY